METCQYDKEGTLLTSTYSDYTPITVLNMPDILYGHIESPSPFTYNGAKGMGEGGAAPLHTVCAALQDALEPTGIIVSDSHNTAETLFQALRGQNPGATVRVESKAAAR
jgi:2-furoyl-CoA dehydrogenase large subunit